MERHSLRDAAIEIASAAWTRYRTAMRLTFLAVLAGLCLSLDALAAGASAPAASVVLVGDSTLAHRSGYGDALCARFQPEVTCFNLAKGGRSSRTYREEGAWAAALEQLAAPGAAARYVLIQFGHNDQPGTERSTTLEQFRENMAGYVRDVRSAGATPVLITPLTRRQFKAGKLEPGLEPWAKAVRQLAKESSVPLLDLHRDSVNAVQALGPLRANELAEVPPSAEVTAGARAGISIEVPSTSPGPDATGLRPAPVPRFDYTHLGPKGADLFADIVARELRASVPALARLLSPKPAAPAALLPLELDVWRAAPPGGEAVTVKQTVVERSTTPGLHDRALVGITHPTLTVYKPEKPDGSAVLILPGGAYLRVVIDKEGEETARRLNARGITAAVLLYRLPADGWAAGRDAPLQDAQRALRLLRSGVAGALDPARIGVLGFSAGGDLAAALALRADGITYEATDQADRVSARPDFSILMYPALNMSVKPSDGKAPIPARAPIESFVNAGSPPCFIVHAADDASVSVELSLRMFSALKAANVPAEMHVFSAGGHGFGVRLAAGKPVESWPDLLVRWGQHHQFFQN
jgi:lysophospholipase L1-like esterase/acetyl esterase/lipase